MCHRHPDREWYPDVWDIPGGHIEGDESAAEAVCRELCEELGVSVRLASAEPFRIYGQAAGLRLHAWVVTRWDGVIKNRAPDEHDDIAWFRIDELAQIDLVDDALVGLLVNALAIDARPSTTDRCPPICAGARGWLSPAFGVAETFEADAPLSVD